MLITWSILNSRCTFVGLSGGMLLSYPSSWVNLELVGSIILRRVYISLFKLISTTYMYRISIQIILEMCSCFSPQSCPLTKYREEPPPHFIRYILREWVPSTILYVRVLKVTVT
jgi:hypothetical protein